MTIQSTMTWPQVFDILQDCMAVEIDQTEVTYVRCYRRDEYEPERVILTHMGRDLYFYKWENLEAQYDQRISLYADDGQIYELEPLWERDLKKELERAGAASTG